MQWPSNVFVTLTYRDEKMPWTSADGMGAPTLAPSDTQLFMKRLNKEAKARFGWQQRFFLVGEYGDRTWRPHYHAAFFNFPACARGNTKQSLSGRYLWEECCSVCRMVGSRWQLGDVGIGKLDQARARYLGGYVVKKMTRKEDARLDGRHPEFSRQSRGGSRKGSHGIGASVVPHMAKTFLAYQSGDEVDVPGTLTRAGGRHVPMGSYLRKKFRSACLVTDEVKENAARQAWGETVLPLLEMAQKDEEAPTLRAQFRKANAPYADRLRMLEAGYQQRRRKAL